MGELLTSDPVNRWMNHLQKTITEQPEVSRSGITYVLPHLETGGTQRQMKELLLGLDRDLFEPRVVAFSGFGSDYRSEIEATGTPVTILPKRKGGDPLILFRLAGAFRRHRPAIVHTLQTAGNRYGILAAKMAGIPHRITTELYYFDWEHKYRILDRLDRLVAHWTSVVVANSHFVKTELNRALHIPLDKMEVVYNGYDLDFHQRASLDGDARQVKRRELGLEDGLVSFAIVARLVQVKNHAMLLRAAGLLKEQGHDFRLLVTGDGALRDTLEEQARQLGLQQQVNFLGTRSDAADIMGAVDLTLLTSHTESLSNAIIESLLTGRPVLATAVGGNPELIRDSENGFLVPDNDHQALAERMLRFILDPSLAATMGRRAQEDARQTFSAAKMVDETCAVYHRLLGK